MNRIATFVLIAIIASSGSIWAGDAVMGIRMEDANTLEGDYRAKEFLILSGVEQVEFWKRSQNRSTYGQRSLGARITDVVSGGAADLADLRPGDVITQLDDVRISEHQVLSAAINGKSSGDVVDVKYVRNGESRAIKLTLGTKGVEPAPRKISRVADEAYQELKDVKAKFYPEAETLADRIEMIEFGYSWELSDRSLEYISKLENVHTIIYPCSSSDAKKVTAVGLEKLANMKSLRVLKLTNLGWTDATVAPLLKTPKLAKLILEKTAITDATVKVIGQLANLEHLNLNDCKVTSAGCQHLKDLKQLRHLELVNTNLAAGMKFVDGMSKLEFLDVDHAELRDEHFVALAGCKQLQMLDVNRNELTDKGLESFRDLKKLIVLSMDETGLKVLKKSAKTDAEKDNPILGEEAAARQAEFLGRPGGMRNVEWKTITFEGIQANLKGLTALQLISMKRVTIANGDVREMARQWPQAVIVTRDKTVTPPMK